MNVEIGFLEIKSKTAIWKKCYHNAISKGNKIVWKIKKF